MPRPSRARRSSSPPVPTGRPRSRATPCTASPVCGSRWTRSRRPACTPRRSTPPSPAGRTPRPSWSGATASGPGSTPTGWTPRSRTSQGARTANEVAQARVLADPSSAGDLATWDFPWEDATLRTLSAQLLEHAGEHQRALDALDGLPATWEALGDGARALDSESLRGVALLQVGRDAEGLALLDDVAVRARAAGATQVSNHAASAAAMWLDQAGRPEEAQAFWERHFGDDG